MLVFAWLDMLDVMENALHAHNMLMKKMGNAIVMKITSGMRLTSNATLLNQPVLLDPNGTRKIWSVNVPMSMNI